jgi:hypothetical protein
MKGVCYSYSVVLIHEAAAGAMHALLPWSDACVWPAVKQCDNPTDEEVDRLHALVVEALVQLYERYKHLLPGWENRPLLVL